jgi:hypothetical protein
MRLRKVNEGGYAGFEERIHMATGGFGIKTARVFAREKTIGFHPV